MQPVFLIHRIRDIGFFMNMILLTYSQLLAIFFDIMYSI
jgi:hypothetical protein